MGFYTGYGDAGTTRIGSKKFSKSARLINALGDLDEFSTALGIAALHVKTKRLQRIINDLQNYIYAAEAEIAGHADKSFSPKSEISNADVKKIEAYIEMLGKHSGSVTKFILPAGSPGAVYLQNARAVARRSERSIAKIKDGEAGVSPQLLKFMNRISTLLFVMALYENRKRGVKEISQG
ncbi:cob(I)yrinic acid a,c-diamide adenosyltransferase [Candidatus Marsarchaeota archaeon]|nr:cob(I)yrinic acid a,c-diamide adenosyltransferase [Candidatus Marsarchaeota archaeon]